MFASPPFVPGNSRLTSRTRDRLWSAWILGVVILASVLRLVEVQAVRSWLDRVLPLVPGR